MRINCAISLIPCFIIKWALEQILLLRLHDVIVPVKGSEYTYAQIYACYCDHPYSFVCCRHTTKCPIISNLICSFTLLRVLADV